MSQMSFDGMPEPPEKYGQEDIPRYAMHRGERMKVDHMLPGSKDHFVLHDKHDVKHVAHRKVLTFIKDAKIIKNAFGVIDKRRPSESRVKAVAQQDADLARLSQDVAAHHAQNRMPKSLTQQQYATIKSRKKVYGYHLKSGWGIHDKTEAVYPAREFYNTSVAPGKDVRRQNQKVAKAFTIPVKQRQKTIAIRAGGRRRLKEIGSGSRNLSEAAEWRNSVSLLHKSYVNGAWKAATKLSSQERKVIRAGGSHVPMAPKGHSNATAKDLALKGRITDSQQALKQALSQTPHAEKKHAGGTVKLVRSADSGMPTSWMANGSKGGQRRNKGVVFHGQMPDRDSLFPRMVNIPKEHSDSYMKHELTHARRRKPMSAFVRIQAHPEKLWGDEARADSVMTPAARADSGYRQVASSDKEGRKRLMSTMGTHYQNDKAPKRYKEVSQKLGTWEKSKHAVKDGHIGKHPKPPKNKLTGWDRTDRNLDRAAIGLPLAAGAVAGGIGAHRAIKEKRAKSRKKVDNTSAETS